MSDKGRPIVGEERRLLAKELVERYTNGGASIRQLADSFERSYGFVQKVLTESGVTRRGRGGTRGGRPPAASHARLVATLAAQHPGEWVSGRQALATLRAAHGSCSAERARIAAEQHNERLTAAEEG